MKKNAASLSVISNSLLIAIKMIVGILSGSISIISEAIHSCADLFASLMAFFAVSKSAEPADEEHPFGHEKYEDLSGFIEGIIIVFAAIFILYETIKRILLNQNINSMSNMAIIVMGISGLVCLFVSNYLYKSSKKIGSVALYAEAQHIKTDVYSSFAILITLLAIKLTKLYILDSIVAIIVATFIFRMGCKIAKQSLNNLLDFSLPEKDINIIKEQITKYCQNVNHEILSVKTRKAGVKSEINITLALQAEMTIENAHKICDSIETSIKSQLGNCNVIIHTEPK